MTGTARVAAAILVLLLGASPALAVQPTTAITGRVLSAGAPAEGVTVTATSDALQGERSTVTTANGRYWLTALPPGRYDVTFSRAGLQTLTKRAVIEIGRVARADAALEPSEDEESITSTAITPSVADMSEVTTHYPEHVLDRLPLRRAPSDVGAITSGTWRGGYAVIDDTYSYQTFVNPFDTLQQLTFLRAGFPVEYGEAEILAIGQSPSGGDSLAFSLRNTITTAAWVAGESDELRDGTQNLTELSAGGPIIPTRLWFFTAAWRGGEFGAGDRSGVLAKLTARIGGQQSLVALFNAAKVDWYHGRGDRVNQATLRYNAAAGPRLTVEAVAEHAHLKGYAEGDSVWARATYVVDTPAGDHVVSAGGQYYETTGYESNSVFVNDRWILRRLTVNAGLRREYDETSPRVGAVLDLLGNGRHALVANHGDYRSGSGDRVRELTLGYAMVVGTTGSARIDVFRRDHERVDNNLEGVQADFHYSLFDRFQTGANYTWLPTASGTYFLEHTGNAWFTLELPSGDGELAVTLLERYLQLNGDQFLTDVGLRYAFPVSRTTVTAAVDALNILDEREIHGRELRVWFRVRL